MIIYIIFSLFSIFAMYMIYSFINSDLKDYHSLFKYRNERNVSGINKKDIIDKLNKIETKYFFAFDTLGYCIFFSGVAFVIACVTILISQWIIRHSDNSYSISYLSNRSELIFIFCYYLLLCIATVFLVIKMHFNNVKENI
jgi:hypothetical protein